MNKVFFYYSLQAFISIWGYALYIHLILAKFYFRLKAAEKRRAEILDTTFVQSRKEQIVYDGFRGVNRT